MGVIFTCQYSAHRAPQCANWYREKTDHRQRVAVLSGGFRGWEATGLPVKSLADTHGAKLADEVAVNLGTKFVEGCLAGVPGGGFFLPTNQPSKPPPQAQSQVHAQHQQGSGGATQKPYIPPHLPILGSGWRFFLVDSVAGRLWACLCSLWLHLMPPMQQMRPQSCSEASLQGGVSQGYRVAVSAFPANSDGPLAVANGPHLRSAEKQDACFRLVFVRMFFM